MSGLQQDWCLIAAGDAGDTRQAQAAGALKVDAQWRPATPTTSGTATLAWETVQKLAASGAAATHQELLRMCLMARRWRIIKCGDLSFEALFGSPESGSWND